MIQVKNLSKEFLIPHQRRDTLKEGFIGLFKKSTYERFKALNNLSLQVAPGEFIGIIGKNGSGKSTLLKILSGIYQPDSGSVEVKGEIAPFLELGIGFQPELTARENIYLNGTLLGMTRKEINQRFDSMVTFAGVENFIDLKVKNYSSGMRARLAFAIAREADADIYLIDEVLAVGDESFQQKCLEVFRDWKRKGKTILFVSHNPGLIEEFCSRVILLDQGRILAEGKAKEVIEQYHKCNSL
ncbi:MAG TPA: ABC transporter ATP-binding protein [Candidatus Gracilibacteria bacterium]|nr:ABC transporter ATP-binding protein [Candidatus Gracilibacteria bacterium]